MDPSIQPPPMSLSGEQTATTPGQPTKPTNNLRASFSGLLSNVAEIDAPKLHSKIADKVVSTPAPHLVVADPKNTPKPENHLRLVCVSDTHTAHGLIDLPAGDVLIHAGDFCDIGREREIDSFCNWLSELKQFKHKIVIAGNHDLSLDPESFDVGLENWKRFGFREKLNPQEQIQKLRNCCTFLQHEAVDIDGIRFFGSPFQPWFHDWAFNLSRDGECHAKWSSMPTNVDVLITHGPPLGHGDLCVGSGVQGCADLLDWVEAFPPKCHVFGHIHEGYGVTTNDKGTAFLNASTMNYHYDASKLNPPLVFDIPIPPAA